MVLPSGLVVPGLEYVLPLAVGTVVLVALLVSIRPPVTSRFVVALAPWMAVGGALHAFYQFGAYPAVFAPLFGAPAVYLTTFDILAVVWLVVLFVAELRGTPEILPWYVGSGGLGVLTTLVVIAIQQALARGGPNLVWPALGFLVSLVVAAVAYFLLSVWQTDAVGRAGFAGGVVVFAHVLDGISTAIGADVFGTGERSPLPRAVMDVAGNLPTADVFGVGWLFVLVKVVIAAGVVVLLSEYVDEAPARGYLLLAFVAAVGLGPATYNLVLFLVGA